MNKFLPAVVLLATALFPVAPDLYDRDRPLYTIETVWFDLIFPEESTTAARYLASFADDLYVEVTALLGTQPRHRLPVVITPDHEWISGYFTSFPYLRIVLYQAAIDLNSSVGIFRDDLRSLFLHELTHAVSLTIRGPVQEALATVFGSPLGLSMYTTPLNFVEGVTLSFESLGGFGRTTDPLSGAMIRQDLLEGKFKSFAQTMGTWDRYPGGNLYYIYGGYFSRYLQERYGLEKYALLWKRLGSGMLTRPLDDVLFVQGHFRKVYGITLREAWTAFGEAMMLQTDVQANVSMTSGLSAINTLAAGGVNLFWADLAEGAVFAHDTSNGQSRLLFSTGALITRLATGEDGSSMLVSATGYEGGYARLSIHEWDAATGSLARLPYASLRDASYLHAPKPSSAAPRPFLAIQTHGYVTSLVIVQDGGISPLLAGSQRVSYSSPVATPEGWIYVLVKENGVVSILRFQLHGLAVTGLQRLRLPEGLGWIRYLSLDTGILRFSWDDSAFYRLVELEGEVLRYQMVPTSGGIHQAVGVSGSVFFLGHFSEGSAVCTLPADRSELGFLEAAAVWEPAEDLLEVSSVYKPVEDTPHYVKQSSLPQSEKTEIPADARKYSSLFWLLPRFWYPVIAGNGEGLTLAGAAVYFADPIERISGYLSGGWNPQTGTPVYATGIDLDLTPWLIRFSLQEEFISTPSDLNPDRVVRQGSAGLALGVTTRPFSGGSVDFGISGAVMTWAGSMDRSDRYGDWDLGLAHASVYTGRNNMKQVFGKPGLRRGYSLEATVRGLSSIWPEPESPLFGIELHAIAASRFLGFQLAGHAGLSFSKGLLYGPAGAVMQTVESGQVSIRTHPLYDEFSKSPAGTWHMQAEATIRPLSFEVQQAAGPLYARRLNLRTGSRAILTNSTGDDTGSNRPVSDWSIFSRLELAFSPAIGAFAVARPAAWIELWYRPLDETWGLGYVRELSF